jgi:hypothetical protein
MSSVLGYSFGCDGKSSETTNAPNHHQDLGNDGPPPVSVPVSPRPPPAPAAPLAAAVVERLVTYLEEGYGELSLLVVPYPPPPPVVSPGSSSPSPLLTPVMPWRRRGERCCSSLMRLRSDILISNEASHTTRSPPVAVLVDPSLPSDHEVRVQPFVALE